MVLRGVAAELRAPNGLRVALGRVSQTAIASSTAIAARRTGGDRLASLFLAELFLNDGRGNQQGASAFHNPTLGKDGGREA
jgi:hypothetical protein